MAVYIPNRYSRHTENMVIISREIIEKSLTPPTFLRQLFGQQCFAFHSTSGKIMWLTNIR